ncbi:MULTISPECIES: ABC transporter permease [unclassified Bacillus (in: firmicutes)]|uniref:ABC transporter permease n=1 Tax=unclassified Bacillus (in: firmicutes) TaxID=185979 RepID=UPI0008E07244|nr:MULTISPECIES: ABC transporter permease [unclassified Bacillus (in: firmicutes)]SFI01434.1 ABC-2 type transport system permease protein [Bacillus sp. 71mf]SFS92335.1 ABC-2 type transport system permease protein [Bacillus sp. 103mf]
MIRTLFYKRLFHEMKRKWKAVRSVVDWTIALYAVVPVLVFSWIYYASLWKNGPKDEDVLYLSIGLFVFYISTYSRGVRSFLEQADSLFLIQFPDRIKQMMKYGMIYSFCRICFTSALVTILFLPILLKSLHGTGIQAFFCFVFLTYFRFALSLLQRYIDVRFHKQWQVIIIKNILFCVGIVYIGLACRYILQHPFYTILFFVFLLIISFFLVKEKMEYHRFFFKEIEKEKGEEMRWTTQIMAIGGQVQKPTTTAKPWLFPRSKRILLGNSNDARIIEAFLKEYFRSGDASGFYIQVIFASAIAIWRAPWWIAVIVISFALFAIYRYSSDKWKVFSGKLFLQLYCPEGKILWLSQKAKAYLIIPALCVYGIAALAHFYMIPAVVCAGIVIGLTVWILFIPNKKKS